MDSPRFLIAITVANFAVLLLSVTNLIRPAIADEAIPTPVLRARSLQIVDEQNRVRASISVIPASTSGATAPETVLFRLITERGRPSVKVGASEDKSGVSVAGPSGTKDSYAILEANADSSSLKLRAENGRERILSP